MSDSYELLVVEDDPDHAEILMYRLERATGWQLKTLHVDRLAAASAALRERPFDLALVDLGLPDGGLYETMESLNRSNPHGTPIIALSAMDEASFAREQVSFGARECLAKANLTEDRIESILRKYLKSPRVDSRLGRV